MTKEKEELCKDIISWIDNAIDRLNELKKSALEMVKKGQPLEELDDYTMGVIGRIIEFRETQLKRKKYVRALLERYKKERKEIETKSKERERTKGLLEGYRKEREEWIKTWEEIKETLGKARRKIPQYNSR